MDKGKAFKANIFTILMGKKKPMKSRGKIKFSEYFKSLIEGDRVAIKQEKGVRNNLQKKMQGKTGVVSGKRGSNYEVKIKDIKKEKLLIVHPVHLKKIKQIGLKND
jgi:large subunit ribosomal protein L21e